MISGKGSQMGVGDVAVCCRDEGEEAAAGRRQAFPGDERRRWQGLRSPPETPTGRRHVFILFWFVGGFQDTDCSPNQKLHIPNNDKLTC